MIVGEAVALMGVSLAVALLPAMSRVARLPGPVAEILLGVVLGKSLLNLEFGGQWLPFLADLGFLVLMFRAGMEIDFSMIARQSWRGLGFQATLFGLTLILAAGGAFVLGRGLFMTLVLTTTSLGLVLPSLKEAGQSRTPLGQGILVAATLADFLTLIGITLFVLWHRYGPSWRMVAPLSLFAGFALLLWCIRLWAWWYPDKAKGLVTPGVSHEPGMRFSLALLFLFVGISELEGVEPVLGAFLGGAILSLVFRRKDYLEGQFSALGFGFLVPLFFIHVGMQFDAHNLMSAGRLTFTLALVLVALAVKLGPALLWRLRGARLREALAAGSLLSARLSLIIAAAAVGLQEGFLDEPTKDAVVGLALISCFLGPTLYRLVRPAGAAERGT